MPSLRWYAVAWALFAISMALPVADIDLRGWEAFTIALRAPFHLATADRADLDSSAFEVSTYWIPNLLMLLSPFFATRRPGPLLRRTLLAAGVVSLVVALLPLRSVAGLQIGYWVWLGSIVVLLAAILRQRLTR